MDNPNETDGPCHLKTPAGPNLDKTSSIPLESNDFKASNLHSAGPKNTIDKP